MSPTDSEQREVVFEGFPAQRDLESVALGEDPAELRVRGLAVEGRVDVGPSREDQRIQAAQQLLCILWLAGDEHDGQAAGLLDRSHIVGPEQVEAVAFGVVADRDPDGGAGHIRSGTGIPRRPRSTSICLRKVSTTRVRNARRSSVSAYSSEYFGFW
jgi:hypothetical protein